MNTFMKYIQIVITDMKEQFMQRSLSTVEVVTHFLAVFQIGIVFWVVVEIEES